MTSFENIQVKITPRERIFHQRQPSLKNINQINPPQCFYHPDDEISFFCKNPRCTLPLCQKCLNIHRMEHLNRKQIPMQNVITFKECKEFALTQLKQSKLKVKSNHKEFQVKLMKYKESLFEVIESSLLKLKDKLQALDKENSILQMEEISESIERISNQSSLTDIIRCYEEYYEKSGQKRQEQNSSRNKVIELRPNSIIDQIKFAVDQIQLTKVIQKGFLNCKFSRQGMKTESQVITQKIKLNCQQYLSQSSGSPFNQNSIITPINKLHQLHEASIKDFNNIQQHVTWRQNVPVNEFPTSQRQTVIEVKKQERRSIFKQTDQKEKQNKTLVSKIISSNDFTEKDIKKQLKRQPLFSAVKKYNIESESQNLEFVKKDNESYTAPAETPHVSRTNSNSSMKSRGKGISLVKAQALQEIDHFQQNQKQTINKIKNRLRSQTNPRDKKQMPFSRQSLSDWKRVVNLTDSNVNSSRRSKLSNQRQNLYIVKNEEQLIKTDVQGLQQFKDIIQHTDVLNPMQMRQLLLRKRNNVKTIEKVNYLI